MDFLVDTDSKDAFKPIGFSSIMRTDDVKSSFVVVAGDIVPTILYSNIISWVKYGRDFYQYGKSDQIMPTLELKNILVECITQFLCTDMDNFKSSSVDPRTIKSLKALVRHLGTIFHVKICVEDSLLWCSKIILTLLSGNNLTS
jgi:hypothetical protein